MSCEIIPRSLLQRGILKLARWDSSGKWQAGVNARKHVLSLLFQPGCGTPHEGALSLALVCFYAWMAGCANNRAAGWQSKAKVVFIRNSGEFPFVASGTSLQIQQDIHINGKSQRNGPAVIVAPGTLDGFCLVLFRVLLTQHHSIKGIKSPLVYPWVTLGVGWLVLWILQIEIMAQSFQAILFVDS